MPHFRFTKNRYIVLLYKQTHFMTLPLSPYFLRSLIIRFVSFKRLSKDDLANNLMSNRECHNFKKVLGMAASIQKV